MRSRLLTGAAVLVLVALTGCAGDRITTVTYRAGSAGLPVGTGLRVKLGPTTPSIGDGWYVTRSPDRKVLKSAGQKFVSDCRANQAGCGG